MYIVTMQVHGPAASDIYRQLAETYNLPAIETLVVSLGHEVSWHCDRTTQVYFLDNLREPNRRNLFQVRFEARAGAHDLIALFLSLEADTQVGHMLTIRLPRAATGASPRA